jgi:UbiD family decarboxylase
MEDCWMAKAWEAVLLAFLRRLVPAVSGLCFPQEWIFHQSGIISLENPNPAMVRETAARLWHSPWFSGSRLLIFVDAGVNPSDLAGVAWHAINHCEFGTDSFGDNTGNRRALDATGCRLSQQRIEQDSIVSQQVAKRWKEYGLS